MTWSKVGIVAAVCGSMMIGYCIYFDRKRRTDPDFKKKLRERREARKTAEKMRSGRSTQFPRFDDHEAVQAFFLREIQMGEELLGQGKVDECVEHIANAVSVCGQPQQLLGVLQQTLPPRVFSALVERLPIVGQVHSEKREETDVSPCEQCAANRARDGASSANAKFQRYTTNPNHRKTVASHRVPGRVTLKKQRRTDFGLRRASLPHRGGDSTQTLNSMSPRGTVLTSAEANVFQKNDAVMR